MANVAESMVNIPQFQVSGNRMQVQQNQSFTPQV